MRYYSSIIGILFVLMAEAGYSQADLPKEKVQELMALNDQLEGTWQIQMVGTRSQPIIPIDLMNINGIGIVVSLPPRLKFRHSSRLSMPWGTGETDSPKILWWGDSGAVRHTSIMHASHRARIN